MQTGTNPLALSISGDSEVCRGARALGFRRLDRLAEHVRSLAYARPADDDVLAVLREARGTCSSKHRLLAAVAADSGHVEVELVVGVYALSEANTPGVGAVLAAAGLASLPEAHAYLVVDGERLDFTGLASGTASPFEALSEEHVVSPAELALRKPELHRRALAAWAEARETSLESAWATREACIAALTARARG